MSGYVCLLPLLDKLCRFRDVVVDFMVVQYRVRGRLRPGGQCWPNYDSNVYRTDTVSEEDVYFTLSPRTEKRDVPPISGAELL